MKDPAQKAREEADRLRALAFPKENGDAPELDENGNPKPAPVDPPVDPPVPPVEDKPEDDQKYEALLAKYNSEVPRLHSWNREKDEKIALLTTENTELKRQVEELKTAAPAPDFDDEGKPLYRSPHVTDEIRKSDAYQYYLGELGQTYAERQAEMSVLAAQSTVKPVEEKVTKAEARDEAADAWNAYLTDLTASVPDWRTVNNDAEFIAWLQNPIPGVGRTYHEQLLEVHNAGNVTKTAEIFNLFKSTNKAPAPPPKPTIPPHLAAPPKAGGGAHTVIDNNHGQVMRMTDLEALYADFSRGAYRGKEAEYEAKKREFMQAKAEGRLV